VSVKDLRKLFELLRKQNKLCRKNEQKKELKKSTGHFRLVSDKIGGKNKLAQVYAYVVFRIELYTI
jgi:hypothetical protein